MSLTNDAKNCCGLQKFKKTRLERLFETGIRERRKIPTPNCRDKGDSECNIALIGWIETLGHCTMK